MEENPSEKEIIIVPVIHADIKNQQKMLDKYLLIGYSLLNLYLNSLKMQVAISLLVYAIEIVNDKNT